MTSKNPEPKPLFVERMKKILSEDKDFQDYIEILKTQPPKSLRVNKLKISPKELRKKLEDKGWKVNQIWPEYPEVMITENILEPGEFGRSFEHLLGYYYIQELSSMLPVIALQPEKNEFILDLCAAPGSKTTQIASQMENTGTIIANEVNLGRIKILSSNLERCGVTNTIITRKDAIALCKKLNNQGFKFDKILLDVPCSGEGTLRSTPKTYVMWNPKTISNLSKLQKQIFKASLEILKKGGTIVYSTCTHAPEENEGVVSEILNEFKDSIKIEEIKLPVKFREGIIKWENQDYNPKVKKCARIYPQDNDTEGFFLAKFTKIK